MANSLVPLLLTVAAAIHAVSTTGDVPLQEKDIRTDGKQRPTDAADLFTHFARMKGLEVSFREEKHIALLAVPLESRGKLYYMAPGHLCRIVEAPERSRLAIGPDELRMESGGEVQKLDLRRNADLRVFITSLVRIFSGDRAGLEPAYHLHFVPHEMDVTRWSLRLEPRERPLTEMLRTLELSGTGYDVREIRLVEPNGDRTITTVLEANPKRVFNARERTELFGLDPSEGERPGEANR